jgi:hypothetical protein
MAKDGIISLAFSNHLLQALAGVRAVFMRDPHDMLDTSLNGYRHHLDLFPWLVVLIHLDILNLMYDVQTSDCSPKYSTG